jgi:hypothetical protein
MIAKLINKKVHDGKYRTGTNTVLEFQIMYDREYAGKTARLNTSEDRPTGFLAMAVQGTVVEGLELIPSKKLKNYERAPGLIFSPYSKSVKIKK